ncbi:hypothetical protein PULV_a1654 [Pseudoalteromonas ulvae UL12]|uniref:hypothetical protein n=1 Tax=Pseudoalteromonas ulvae TaxID=107327 RepID=UPI00186BAF02|nr:hypothetical protein [Pseudoalteromonas ulvae]MBE0364099.1 hypothetical protein [Pseudoalteromonas ulvae UL12]
MRKYLKPISPKYILLVIILFSFSCSLYAQRYVWTDGQGVKHNTSKPPPISCKTSSCKDILLNKKNNNFIEMAKLAKQERDLSEQDNRSVKTLGDIKRFPDLTADIAYITFKWGGSACSSVSYWQEAIDLIEAKSESPFQHIGKQCKYLRENTIVQGILEKVTYKNTQFAKVKASDDQSYWIELPALLPVTSRTMVRPTRWATDLRPQ